MTSGECRQKWTVGRKQPQLFQCRRLLTSHRVVATRRSTLVITQASIGCRYNGGRYAFLSTAQSADRRYLSGGVYMHVFVEGSVVVTFTVTNSGSVTKARIVKSSYNPIGIRASYFRKPGYFDGFLDMNVLPTLKGWRFPPRSGPCSHEVTFTYRMKR